MSLSPPLTGVTKTRKDWEDIFDGTDAGCTPVLEITELEATRYDPRPLVGLTVPPARLLNMSWTGKLMIPSSGGEDALREWVGWQRGKHVDVQAGAMVLKKQSNL